ncbi:NAD-dependent succinate-semialdehyde dehydrogenase [Robiginitomaculum antarcticum]|uniref:NAD-dependent succinate-semialdehyde dehydrogenase n=1 Tax=Robiginitomaculum antarcticum TaxID=437507 RepID=UPI00037E443F|nr:NAD-dependent succinate-semialdehyde dehydrogenase [Robiginitomaculum antarcticum]
MNAIVTINPYTEKPITHHKMMNDFEVAQAVEECHTAFLKWREETPEARAKIISKIGKALLKNEDKLAKLITDEMGKLLSQSHQEVQLCAGICDWTAQNGPGQLEDEKRDVDSETRGVITYSPIGVIYGIQPWNYPTYQVIRYSISNLMAGNGVLLKHASCVTGTGQLLAQIYSEAGLPDGLFTSLIISHEQSDAVIRNERVRGVTLTGSSEAGRYVAEKCASVLKKTVLELGSNDAYIVLADADLEKAVEICVQGRVYNNGETCIAAKRFIVVDEIYDDFKAAFVKAMSNLTVGDPTKDDVDMGPMARKDLRETLHKQVKDSVAAGAKILCGGKMPDRRGYFYPATVLGNVLPGQPAYDDELFDPVASLIHAENANDAMRIANDSRFGLGGGIISEDVDGAVKLASEHFDTGMVFINRFGLAVPNMPFGGVKDSGNGREHGGFGLKEFMNIKSVIIQK